MRWLLVWRTRVQHADGPRDDVGVRILFGRQDYTDIMLSTLGKTSADVCKRDMTPMFSRALLHLKRVSGGGDGSEFRNQA